MYSNVNITETLAKENQKVKVKTQVENYENE